CRRAQIRRSRAQGPQAEGGSGRVDRTRRRGPCLRQGRRAAAARRARRRLRVPSCNAGARRRSVKKATSTLRIKTRIEGELKSRSGIIPANKRWGAFNAGSQDAWLSCV